ncbi:TetR/AcrR family transcriptional regulator [Noviherbaspirillum saxi]|uniref:TetR/AcrR family transcriptional regulator n=1 Tax=Noviherbaspirillum saxi TaxID=2320863 RepID=A0A3A3FEC7_9BURK|nr:TetR/AcrR family transcriptional regulator [Noviherbaspirillum saxi]RJF91711.1 TetR/AcrR family transcriptional regulator [Noviherbaspirillum saxi]
MNTEVTKNKQGQTLGRKGQETRAKLMEAARQLLDTHSPVELTAVSIAAEAGTSPASFYMYFDDTKDILFALSEVAGEDMAAIHAIFDQAWTSDDIEEHARKVIDALNEVWARHRQVLRFRNMEADRGDPRFEELRMNTYVPFIERFAQRILAISPPSATRKRADVYSEATILHAAMERLAATEPSVMEKGLGLKRITNNLARVVKMVVLGGQAVAKVEATAPATKAAAVQTRNEVAPGVVKTKPRSRVERTGTTKTAKAA